MDSEKCQDAIAVVITYPSLLIVVGIDGDMDQHSYDPAIFLISEMDGVRILTNSSHEIIKKVPKCTQNIYAITSYHQASSCLLMAHQKFIVN